MTSPKPSLDELRIERNTRSNSGVWPWAVVLLLVILLAGLTVWLLNKPGAVKIQTVLARETSLGNAQRTVLNASGYVTARRAATVSSKVTGKVVEVLIEEGIKVQEGQILARLDDTNVRAGLRLAEAQLESASRGLTETTVRIREAELELKRQSDLLKNNISTKADFDRAEAATHALQARLEQQKAEVTVAERQVASWQQQVEDTIIRAPFAGIVTVKNAQPGEMISPISAGGGFTRTGICTIVDMQSLEIEIDVNESYINRVESGQPVEATLDAYPEWKIPCRVIAIIPTADRQKSTVRVRVGFQRLEPRILPDMSVKVAFHEGLKPEVGQAKTSGVVVPRKSVLQENGRDYVFVVRDGRVDRRAIAVSSSNAEDVIVSSGINTGDKLVISPPPQLRDGSPVKELRTRQ